MNGEILTDLIDPLSWRIVRNKDSYGRVHGSVIDEEQGGRARDNVRVVRNRVFR